MGQGSAERVCLHQAERAFFGSRMGGSGAGDGQKPRLCSDKRAGRSLQNRRCGIRSRTSGPQWSRANLIWEIPEDMFSGALETPDVPKRHA
jgi:hypothetical protein